MDNDAHQHYFKHLMLVLINQDKPTPSPNFNFVVKVTFIHCSSSLSSWRRSHVDYHEISFWGGIHTGCLHEHDPTYLLYLADLSYQQKFVTLCFSYIVDLLVTPCLFWVLFPNTIMMKILLFVSHEHTPSRKITASQVDTTQLAFISVMTSWTANSQNRPSVATQWNM